MKKITTVVSSIVLFATISSAFASNLTCPPIQTIRSKVKLERAAQLGDERKGIWGLTSNAFGWENVGWNVLLFATFPNMGNPAEVVMAGQNFFDSSVLMTPTVIGSDGNSMSCMYTGDEFKYSVYAETPVDFGLARAKALAKL